MENETICLNHLNRVTALLDTITVIQLDGAEIGEQKDIGRQLSHFEGVSYARLLQSHPLRPYSHRQPQLLSCEGQIPVDFAGELKPARHRGDQKGRFERLSEKSSAEIYLVEIDFGEGVMHKGEGI